MKRFLSVILAAIITLSLASCLQVPDNGGTSVPNDGVVYSPEVGVSIVQSDVYDNEYVGTYFSTLRATLMELGVSTKLKGDSGKADSSEIILGESTREASVYGYGKLREAYLEGNVSYVICYKSGAIAVCALDEYSFSEAMRVLYRDYLKSSSLKVATDLEISVNMTQAEYAAFILDENIDNQVNGWEDRWSEAEAILGTSSIDMMKNLYDCFGTDVYTWLAGLYDKESGAFYYAESGLAYEGFLPDVESTCQALKIIYNSGMVSAYGKDLGSALSAALPKDMQDSIVKFVQGLESEEDGYFYHPQWGTGIADDRKGRDLQWATQILDWFDAEPLYPTAIDRLKDSSAAEAVSKIVATAAGDGTHSDRFKSEENFLAYLADVMDSDNDGVISAKESYNSGHAVASQSEQIKAAGLLDVCCDYFDGLQKTIYDRQVAAGQTPSGLWSDEVSYNSISGFFKISVLYSTAKRGINYVDRVADSALACILSEEEVGQVVFAYNPWAALGEAVAGASRANQIAEKAGTTLPYDMNALYGRVRAKLPQLLLKTIEKSMIFKKDDGGFSYNELYSAAKIQGVSASLGLPEGDVNATTLLCSYMINYIWTSIGVEKVDLWSATDFDEMMRIIDSTGAIIKTPGFTEYEESFDDVDDDTIPYTINIDSGANVYVTSDKEDDPNKYIVVDSAANHPDGFKIYPRFTNTTSCYTFEADIKVSDKSSGYTHQISFYSASRLYMITLKGSTTSVAIGDASDVSGTGVISTSSGVAFPTGEWFKLGVEIYNEEQFHAKIYVNGECVYISENYIGVHNGAQAPEGSVTSVWVYNLSSPSAKLAMDNISMALTDKKFSADDLNSSTELLYDFEKYDYKVGGNIQSTDAFGGRISDPTESGRGTVYQIKKTSTNRWDAHTLKLPTEKSESLTVSMDMYVNSFKSSTVVQIALGTMDNDTSYMLSLKATADGFVLSEASTNMQGATTNVIGTFSQRQWYTVTITITVTDDPDLFEAKVCIGDVEYYSTLPFNLDGSWEEVKTTLDALYIRANSATEIDMYLDNVQMIYE